MRMEPISMAFWAIVAMILVSLTATMANSPVTRVRLERFARRQCLDVSAANGDQIIRYLATTRRWRTAGLGLGFLATVVWSLPQPATSINSVALFAGWFLGALVAEIRVAHLAHGERRAASLQPRRPAAYLSRPGWALVPGAAALAMAVAVLTACLAAFAGARPDGWAAGWLGAALATAAAVRAIQLHVLRRPQPLTAPDVLAADDAIRSRSLHVLAGGGTALVLLCVSAQFGAIHPRDANTENAIQDWLELVPFLVAALGWYVATLTWPPGRRSRPVITRPTTATPEPG
jgi:hypothetical protein